MAIFNCIGLFKYLMIPFHATLSLYVASSIVSWGLLRYQPIKSPNHFTPTIRYHHAMVSYSAQGRDTKAPEFDRGSSKKRKWECSPLPDHLSFLQKRNKWSEFEPETPLPLDWQRCLDIQSGKLHFYNTSTQKRTSKDPRMSPDPPGSPSLELELNLPCDSQRKPTPTPTRNPYRPLGGLHGLPSWLAFEGDRGEEMVATVCAKCHMLVMLCKSSPSCPNCKFMHPPAPSNSFKLCL